MSEQPEVQVVVHKIRKPAATVPSHVFKAVETKQLTIRLQDKNAPDYTFQGDWSGRDIMVVARTIVRAYRKEQLAKRHNANTTQQTSAIGASNV